MCGFQFGGTNGGKGWKVLYKEGIYLVKCRVVHCVITSSTSFILFLSSFYFLFAKTTADLFLPIKFCQSFDSCLVFEYKIFPSTLTLRSFGIVAETFTDCTLLFLMTFCSQVSYRP